MEESMTAYLFVDTFAFEKLVVQPECRAGRRDAQMAGYETYLIEQWACERKVNTVVASYTGNMRHIVEVQVLWVPRDLSMWSTVLFSHFEELMKMHILPKETPLGNMLVTSLSSLPTNLTLVSMPAKYREGYSNFVVNEDLRRLNVTGRIAVTAEDPTESSIAAFRRYFSTSPIVSGDYSVQELVTLIQTALFYFGLLAPNLVDGFLCDKTLAAIETWWSTVGRIRYRTMIHPRSHEKLYMRTSCAALVGMVTGARQRLSALNLKPPKDPFDPEEFVTCIRRFQKIFKLQRTAVIDSATYSKLLTVTEKYSSNNTNTVNVLSMMKSTVKEGISGKAAGAVDDWETLDIDLLAASVRGERCKYLWQGKGEPTVKHLCASMSIEDVGRVTKIPLFSLPNAQHHARQNSQPSNQLPDSSGHPHGSSHQRSRPPTRIHSRNQSTTSVNTPYQSPTSDLATPHRRGSEMPSGPENLSDVDWEEKLRSPQYSEEQHKALLSRFKWHRGSKGSLAEPFEETHEQRPSHLRRHSGSSDYWFAQHESPSAVSTTNNSSTALPSSLERTTVVEEEAETPKRLDYWDTNRAMLLTKDDLAITGPEPPRLRRSASLSSIECTVFPYDGLAPMPEVVELYEKARGLQASLRQQIEDEMSIKHKLGNRISSNESTLADMLRDNMVIKYHMAATTKKEETVKRRLGELEAFMARLDYELATLSAKLNDIDQSVLAFAAKVDSTDSRWNQMNKEQSSPWWKWW